MACFVLFLAGRQVVFSSNEDLEVGDQQTSLISVSSWTNTSKIFKNPYAGFHDYSPMDSLEGQTLDHREKAHSLAFLLFFAKEKEKMQTLRLLMKIRQILQYSHMHKIDSSVLWTFMYL